MNVAKLLNFLNACPYVFFGLGDGVVLRFQISEDDGESIGFEIYNNKLSSGIVVDCMFVVFNFRWNTTKEKWTF